MIGGQTLFVNKAEENFILARNEANPVDAAAVAEAAEATEDTAFIEGGAAQTDLKAKFARLKKAMRKRSSSIF